MENAVNRTKGLIRLAVILAIAGLAMIAALALQFSGAGGMIGSGAAGVKLDEFFYDAFYRLRTPQDMRDAEVVLVAVDEASMTAAQKPWPWPRTMWSDISKYLDDAGAKVIVFDIVFPNPSYYGDDEAFAAGMNAIRTPVVYGSAVRDDGSWEPFAPEKIEKKSFGAVNLGRDKVYRRYLPEKNGQPSEAEMTFILAGADPEKLMAEFPGTPEGFLLHYYGPHKRGDGAQTFRFIPAFNVLQAQRGMPAAVTHVEPAIFKGKIVILCAIALGTFDLKTSPLSDEYPGPEIQATAIENMLRGQQVHVAPVWIGWLLTAAGALLATMGIVLPRWASIKVAAPVIVGAALLLTCILAFGGAPIWWISPVIPLTALLVASPLAFGYTYFAEDRRRRFMLKALSKVVSPAVAQQLAREPQRLALGTVQREITVLFTDLANFTDLSEGMSVQDLGILVNRYLGEMSAMIFQQDGTLDKYIGDAVMCFWNAPLPQKDHALRACRAALAMAQRERELQDEFRAVARRPIFTRVGINTTSAAVGFVGSEHLFNYTALGDGINLASRMEGANKMYGSQILLSETTALLVGDAFHVRKLDVLRVKGKQQPMGVYELLAPREGEAQHVLAARVSTYEAAFERYQARHWDDAERLLLELCAAFGEDGPAQALLERVRAYRRHPPPETWDGVYVSTSK